MTNNNLYPLPLAANLLGGISVWTLRKHVARRNVKVVRLGRRVFLSFEEVERIRQEGLPSLGPDHQGGATTMTSRAMSSLPEESPVNSFAEARASSAPSQYLQEAK
jgi:hypothetical protein